jgi:hypothetical protein
MERFVGWAVLMGRRKRELRAMVRSSGSYEEFLDQLNRWADNELLLSHSAR